MGSIGNPPTTRALDDDSAEAAEERPKGGDPVLPKLGHLVVGKYRIDGVLGRGGMGVVAAGHQLNLDRPVAIKFLRHALGGTARHRFTREAMAIAKIENEHVVRVFDAGEEDGVPFIVMERLVGNDLADELRLGPLAPDISVRYVLEACEALAEAHEHGIVHRDLKPSNLFIAKGASGRRTVKVLDFGVSKWLHVEPGGSTPLSTGEHGFIGTPAYVSPEQLTTPNAVDQRTDVWALGVVLYQCLSGKRPFDARGVPQLCAAILTSEPADFEPELGVPDSLAAIVWRCLRKKPAERYANVRELAGALEQVRAPRGRSASVLGGLRKRPLLVAVGLALLAAVAVAVAARAPAREEPKPEAVAIPERVAAPPHEAAALPPAPPPRATFVAPPEPKAPDVVPSTRTIAPRVESRRPKLAPAPSVTVEPAASAPTVAEPEPSARPNEKRLYRR